jgi:hypothetical protein
MGKRFRFVSVVIGCLAVGLGAEAAAPKYSFLELGYSVVVDADLEVADPGLEADLDGGNATSLGIAYGFEAFQVFAGYRTHTADYDLTSGGVPVGSAELERDNWYIGGGWHGLLGEPGDLVINWGYNRLRDLTEGRGGEDNNAFQGFFADIGIRWRIVKPFEINGCVRYGDLDEIGGYSNYEINALGYVGRLVLGVGYDLVSPADLDDESRANVFVRYNMGKN